jgi:hypothetical protein
MNFYGQGLKLTYPLWKVEKLEYSIKCENMQTIQGFFNLLFSLILKPLYTISQLGPLCRDGKRGGGWEETSQKVFMVGRKFSAIERCFDMIK